jgi:hypothetical protein
MWDTWLLNQSPPCGWETAYRRRDRAWLPFYPCLLLYSSIIFPKTSTKFITRSSWRQRIMQAVQKKEVCSTPVFPLVWVRSLKPLTSEPQMLCSDSSVFFQKSKWAKSHILGEINTIENIRIIESKDNTRCSLYAFGNTVSGLYVFQTASPSLQLVLSLSLRHCLMSCQRCHGWVSSHAFCHQGSLPLSGAAV